MSLSRQTSSRLRLADRASLARTATLVAIAKNEAPYIVEWLAHHLAIGFAGIIVYDDHSTDGTLEILERIATICPEVVARTSRTVDVHDSPQTTAYNDAVTSIASEWTMCLDIDEFLVPFRDYTVDAFLARVPEDVSSLHINWKGFGSGGLVEPDYGFVVEAFTRCSPAQWGNNYHFKSIARTKLIEKAYIHNITTTSGRRVLSDLEEFETIYNGISSRVAHAGIQVNHYQCKTYKEFKARMERGDANYHPEHALRSRDGSHRRFLELDRNEEEDTAALVFAARFRRYHREVSAAIAS